jgi:hypothetical protein
VTVPRKSRAQLIQEREAGQAQAAQGATTSGTSEITGWSAETNCSAYFVERQFQDFINFLGGTDENDILPRGYEANLTPGGPSITYELASTFMLYVAGGTKGHGQDSDTACMSTLITYWSAFGRLIRLRTHASLPPQLSGNIARFITSEIPKRTPIMAMLLSITHTMAVIVTSRESMLKGASTSHLLEE